ncbi:hypothetical protein DRH14_00485 [Candidatus Shapirobacteria bacterium]|nr:MAG: hypothetical protein DRH14_00485 [Candidatus Shapirobacteria bacterium]
MPTIPNLIFFGASTYSNIVLQSLLSQNHFHLSTVVTKNDQPLGRHHILTPNPVALFAQQHQLSLIKTNQFDSDFRSKLQSLKSHIILVVAYGPPFFDQQLIDLPQHKIVNIHPSPLPKYRGATPGPWQIINQEKTSAVTFFQIDSKPDHGPIIVQIPFDISPTATSQDFYQQAFQLASQHLIQILDNYIKQPQQISPQDHSQATYFPKLNKQQAQIDWSWPVSKIEAFVRAMQPWPIAWTTVKNRQSNQQLKMKILTATIDNNQLIPQQVQLESKNPTSWPQIQKYYQIIK